MNADVTWRARVDLVVLAALVVLWLPFEANWFDFELARRGVLGLVAAALLVVAWRGAARHGLERPTGALPLALVCAWSLARSFGVTNGPEAIHATTHALALLACFAFGAALRRDDGDRAADSVPSTRFAAGTATVLVVTALYGIAQTFGVDWPAGYARAAEPVSTFGNRNVAAECTAVAVGVVVATARALPSWLARSSAALGSAYLVLNGSRGGLLALAVAGALAAVAGGAAARRAVAALVVAGGLAFGATSLLATDAAPEPAPSHELLAFDTTERPSRPQASIDVRFALWRSTLDMVLDAPLLGHGAGQFRYEYPRFRSADEIELTTFGRQFPTFAMTPHNDALEIAAELGGVGLALWLWFGLAVALGVVRARGPRTGALLLVPLVAFVVVGLVRSPLGNAPCAMLAFVWAGAIVPPARGHAATTWPPALRLVLAIAAATVLAISVRQMWAQHIAAHADRAVEGTGEPLFPFHVASDAHGSESRYHSLFVSQVAGLATDPKSAYDETREHLAAIATHDPHNVAALIRTATLAHRAGDDIAARAALKHALELDPQNPEAALLAAIVLLEAGDVARGIATLYADPHPRLRAVLAATLGDADLLQRVAARGNAAAVDLLITEARFVAALDAVLAEPGSAVADRSIDALAERVSPRDPRLGVLRARQIQARGAIDADALARLVPTVAISRLTGAQRRLLAPLRDALAVVPAWAAWFAAAD